jgi:Pyruvate/2-oxoacid:ferredoxin oxidoreductase delta subunit
MFRRIVKIDQDKCNGCGLCVSACAEGAIQLINGKAQLVKDNYCDGLGACLGECPQDAISIEERDAEAFNEDAVKAHLKTFAKKENQKEHACGCPGMQVKSFEQENVHNNVGDVGSELRQWPVQLHLVPTVAPYWDGADLLFCADCVAVSYGNFQRDLLRGKRIIIACPKLDETDGYLEKLTAIINDNNIKSITAVRMEVPCCSGIVGIAARALENSGKQIPFNEIIIGINGQIK